jgi:hypothetical protein
MIHVKFSLDTKPTNKSADDAVQEAESKYKDAAEKFAKAVVEMGNKYLLENILINVKVDGTNHASDYEIVQTDNLKQKLTGLFVSHFLQG